MKGVTTWSFRPYQPMYRNNGDIWICRVAPGVAKLTVDWIALPDADRYTFCYRFRGSSAPFTELEVCGTTVTLTNLSDSRDYEFYIKAGEKKSLIRFARTGFVPGDAVINYLHPFDRAYDFSGRYLCSPSLIRHPDGFLLASMDLFEGNSPQNLTLIFRSDDEGKSWYYLTDLFPCYWATLFLHQGKLYVMGVSTEYGDLLIGRSDDGGETFGMPTVLLRGSGSNKAGGAHRNPQLVVPYKGRLWTTLEWGCWYLGGHGVMVASIDENADLLDAAAWSFTPPVKYDPHWEGTAVGNNYGGCLEGNIVVGKDGNLYNMLRYEMGGCQPAYGRAVIMKIFPDEPERPLEFYRVVDFPGNHSKFQIRYDEVSKCYYSLVCYLADDHPNGRNVLSLIASYDLWHWEVAQHVLDYRHLPEWDVGFQYPSIIVDGDDLLFTCRTAFNGAEKFHDANYNTFHRIKNFRYNFPKE